MGRRGRQSPGILAAVVGAVCWLTAAHRAGAEVEIVAVCQARLGELHPGDPDAYRDYAEELAARRRDPAALHTSLRLYLIAAHLEPDRLGRGCLLGMVALARDPQEERRFRAMAYLLDPHRDPGVLKPVAERADPGDEAGRAGLLRAVQATRRGQHRIALQITDRPSVQKTLEQFPDLFRLDEFRAIQGDIPPQTLRKLLILEWLLTREGDEATATAADRDRAWSRLAQRQRLDPIQPLTFRTLTEFDPHESVYREGRWVRPENLEAENSNQVGNQAPR